MMPQCLNVFILLVLIKASVCLKNCTSEQYFNTSAEECQACSHCKLPEVTRIPCNRESDVVCMQLKKLNFIISNRLKINVKQICFAAATMQVYGTNFYCDPSIAWSRFLVDSSPVVTPRQPFHKRDYLSVEASNDTWRLLAYALIGVLCVLVVTVVVSLLVSWHCIRKRKAAMNRYYVEGEGEYVVISRLPDLVNHPQLTENLPGSPPRSPQRRSSRRSRFYRNRRIYRPQRRLMNEYVDDVFESEDSGGSRSLRIPLHTIPEDS